MKYFDSHLKSAVVILVQYKGNEPFASFLKKCFGANKKFGSNDRKAIRECCYAYFRLGKASAGLPVEDAIRTGIFLCSDLYNGEDEFAVSTDEMVSVEKIFPWKDELSNGIDHAAFCKSFFIQPDLFLRIRPAYKTKVILKLSSSGLNYKLNENDCIQLPSSVKADAVFDIDKEVVVQDYNSQKVLNFLLVRPGRSDRVWDCCAASGGKSILAYDILNGKVELTVSDIRESIIANLHQRFKKAVIKNYKHFTADIEKENLQGKAGTYDIIICDAPCTGSGTWSRTPEQLYFFNPASIDEYSSRQKIIASNLIPHLNKDGLLFYITCSVFKKENEDVVSHLQKEHHLELLELQLLKGYDKKADSMFVAVLKK